jgi:hypothetical protein
MNRSYMYLGRSLSIRTANDVLGAANVFFAACIHFAWLEFEMVASLSVRIRGQRARGRSFLAIPLITSSDYRRIAGPFAQASMQAIL